MGSLRLDSFKVYAGFILPYFSIGKRKGEVDALMISLAGVVILAILALIFVIVVGTSLDGAKTVICGALEDKGEFLPSLLPGC